MKQLNVLLATASMLTAASAMAQSHSGTLPVIYVNSQVPTEDIKKGEYVDATYYLDNCGIAGIESIGDADNQVATEIKGRGNYTWTGFDKKPYKLKLAKKATLMGMDKNKHFALLAHADDNMGFMRNIAGFELSRRLGLPWTPMDKPVEFYLNGDYKGLYFVTQTIRIDETRVNITEQDDLATENVDGGWLVEIDNYDTDPHITLEEPTGYPIYFTFQSPEELSDPQLSYLTEQMTLLNNLIYNEDKNSTELFDHLDLDDAVRFYIVQEILDDTESYHGSCYLYKNTGDDKWHFGPVWDFGNAFQRGDKCQFVWENPTFNQTWIGEIYKYPAFQNRVKEIWKEFCQSGYAGLEDYLTDYADYISTAARSNYNRWNQYGNENVVSEKNNMISMIRKSVDWLGDRWGAKPGNNDPEPGVYELYLLGDDNGWNVGNASDYKFTYIGDNKYELKLDNLTFEKRYKIGTDNWDPIDLGAEEEGMTPELEKSFKLVHAGKNIEYTPGIDGHRMIVDLGNNTLLFTKQATGLDMTTATVDEVPEIYTITGQRVEDMDAHGIYILRYSDRTVKVAR
jgi:hypothetical protein